MTADELVLRLATLVHGGGHRHSVGTLVPRPHRDDGMNGWEPTPGQCLCCGGRGGRWSGEFRETCASCHGCGWDPDADEQWFKDLIIPLQTPSGDAA